jgi:WD40 repeat protein
MNQRIINTAALGGVGLVLVGGVALFALSRMKTPPKQDAPPAKQWAVVGTLPPDASAADKTPSAQNKPATVTKSYTWAEVEEQVEKLREGRAHSPAYWSDIQQWYARLADPKLTASKDYPEHLKKLAAWRKKLPQSPTPLVAMACCYIQYAWDARGSGFALEVSDVGWELYHQRIEEAQRLLEESLQLGAKDGEVYSRLIEVAKAKGLPREETDALVEAGRNFDPTYLPIYVSMAEYLLPRWHGEPGDAEKFASELTEKIPGENGLVAFAVVAKHVHYFDWCDDCTLYWGNYNREQLVRAAEAAAKRYPNWSKMVNFAALCTLATQDHAAARRIRPLVGNFNPADEIWMGEPSYQAFIRWAEAKEVPGRGAQQIWGTLNPLGGIAFARNSRFIWCGQGYGRFAATLLDLENSTLRLALPGTHSAVMELDFDAEHNWILAKLHDGHAETILLWDAATSEPLAQIPVETTCRAVAINPKQPLIAWEQDQLVHLSDVSGQHEKRTIKIGEFVHQLRFSRDGTRLLVDASHDSVWDIENLEKLYELPNQTDHPPRALWCDGALEFDELGRVWSLARPRSKPAAQQLVRLSADGKSSEILMSDLAAHGLISRFHAVISPDGKWLAVPQPFKPNGIAAQAIDLWDIERGQRVHSYEGHWEAIGQLAFSGDSKRLASIGASSGVIRVWPVGGDADP